MTAIRVSLIGELYGCVEPLFDGRVRPEGVELAVTRSPSPQAMRRQLTSWEFDVCEMAVGAYLIARARGDDVTAIPIFPRRAFFHTGFLCPADGTVNGPRGLAGKRIGVPEYIQSATIWARGVLERDFGLDARAMQWYVERARPDSTGEVLGFRPPADIRVQQTPGGKSLVEMLAARELDLAWIGGGASASELARLRPLFADPIAEARRFHAAHGYIPANHVYMIRADLLRAHPWLAGSLCRAFEEAKRVARRALPDATPLAALFGNAQLARAAEGLPDEAFAYGLAPNRAMLEALVDLCLAHGLVRERPAVASLFAAQDAAPESA